jgi:hypothetical protein
MRDRNCIAASEGGDGRDRMRLGGRGASSCATTPIGPGIRRGTALQRRRSTYGPPAPRKVRCTLSARCRSGIMLARTQMAVLDKEIRQ